MFAALVSCLAVAIYEAPAQATETISQAPHPRSNAEEADSGKSRWIPLLELGGHYGATSDLATPGWALGFNLSAGVGYSFPGVTVYLFLRGGSLSFPHSFPELFYNRTSSGVLLPSENGTLRGTLDRQDKSAFIGFPLRVEPNLPWVRPYIEADVAWRQDTSDFTLTLEGKTSSTQSQIKQWVFAPSVGGGIRVAPPKSKVGGGLGIRRVFSDRPEQPILPPIGDITLFELKVTTAW